jgi:hypothetical protein
VATVLVGAPAASASAILAGDPQPISFASTSESIVIGQPIQATLHLGSYWDDACVVADDGKSCSTPKTLHIVLDGETVLDDVEITSADVSVSVYRTARELHVGSHTVDAVCDPPFSCATTTPLTLTVTPAQLTVDGRVETDEHHTRGAIVSALLTGDVLDQYLGCDCSLDPAGHWTITITDDDDEQVVSRTVPVSSGTTKDVSFYWNDVRRDTHFTARFSFTPDGRHASDVAVTSDVVQYTSPEPTTPVTPATPDPAGGATAATAAHTPTMPVWVIVAGGAVALAVLIAIAALMIRVASGPVLRVPREELDGQDAPSDSATPAEEPS